MTLETRSTEATEASAFGAGAVLLFLVGGVRCALPLGAVHEVVRAVRISPLPTAPQIVEGVIDLRGLIVPVLDLRARLGLPPVPVRADHVLVVAAAVERTVAVRADAVEWIASLDGEPLVDAERIAHGIGYLAGVARTPDGLVLVHDLSAFLQQGEAEALEAALVERAGARAQRT